MTLIDPQRGLVYAEIAQAYAEELREWSAPCQIRWRDGALEIRKLAQPVKGVYITPDDELHEARL